MENKLIWVLNFNSTKEYLDIELYTGKNKFTKLGLFSGLLRRFDVDDFISDPVFKHLYSIKSLIQSGKNSFKLHKTKAFMLFEKFKIENLNTIYCKLDDNKLHHVDFFREEKISSKIAKYIQENGFGIIVYNITPEARNINNFESTSLPFQPKIEMYLFPEKKNIRGILYFWYHDIEIPAHSSQEKIYINTTIVFRNFKYEKTIIELLLSLGGKKSIKNEFLFKNKNFFEYTLPNLINRDIKLFWGKEKKIISHSKIFCNISYKMNWFNISGGISNKNFNYTLSELLKKSKGKNFVEINDGIIFLPKELKKLKKIDYSKDSIKIASNKLNEVISIANRFNISPENYLPKFKNFSNYDFSIKKSLAKILKPYQKNGIQWIITLYKNGFGGCLADDMGLGKTLQAISFICCEERNSTLPVLIVVPKIVIYNWKNEFYKFAPWLNVTLAYGNFNFSKILENNSIYITTYDTLTNHRTDFEKIKFDTIILDESQFVKNFRTKRYRAIQKINSSFLLALTGTPVENNIEELWALFNLINPYLLGNNKQFMKKYSDVHINSNKLDILKQIVTPFILRRTKEEVLPELPQKKEMYIYCEMENNQRSLYNKLLLSAKEELKFQPSRFKIKDNSVILQALLYLREVCSDPQLLPPTLRNNKIYESCKYNLFKEYFSRVMGKSNKLIVYSMFPKTLSKLETWCKKIGYNTFYIDGSTSNRQNIVDEFEKANQGIFFISLKAGGVGLNLVSCQYVFIYDPWWNTAVEKQATNRIYRIGQEKPVFIYHFLIKDTIEEKIYELQKIKEKLSDDILSNLNSNSKISIKDLYKLIF